MNTEVVKNNDNKSYIIPTVDISETDDSFILKADMPGVKKDDLDIVIDNEELEIKGKFSQAYLGNDDELIYQEYKAYDYYRKFNIGNNIDNDKVIAEINQGILNLTLPKREKLKPKKIDIKSE